jgi:hypothetical protein
MRDLKIIIFTYVFFLMIFVPEVKQFTIHLNSWLRRQEEDFLPVRSRVRVKSFNS